MVHMTQIYFQDSPNGVKYGTSANRARSRIREDEMMMQKVP